MTALAVAACAALALLAVVGLPPRAARRIDPRAGSGHASDDREQRGEPATKAGKELRLAWAGYGFAVTALVGHLAYPPEDSLWAAMLVAAILSVPIAAAIGFLDRRNRRPPDR